MEHQDSHVHDHGHDHSNPLLKFFDFTLSRQAVEAERKKRLSQMAKNAKIQGFRPGKTPMSVIENRYGQAALEEVIDEMAKALVQEKMKEKTHEKLASRVSYHPSGETPDSLIFHAHYEVFPEFTLALDKVPSVKKPKINIDDQAVGEMIAWMCKIYGEDEEADTIAHSDRVNMAFEMCAASDPSLSLLKIDPYQFVVPKHKPEAYIDFPANALIGKKVGELVTWEHDYADDFANPLVAGQKILLKADIQSITRKKPLEEEVLFDRLGLKDKNTEDRHAEIRKQINNQVERRITSTFSTRVGKALRQAHAIDVPPTMFNAELHQQGERVRTDIHALQHATTPREQSLLKRLEAEAKHQLQTQIVWLKISESMTEKVQNEEVLSEIRRQCEEYEGAEAVYQQMIQNREALMQAYEVVQQQKMMAWLLPQIKVEDEEVSFSEFMIG